MNYCCAVTAAPLRFEPNHRAEMVSQILFGEHVIQINQQADWIKIACCYDGYEGWVELKSLLPAIENKPDGFEKMVVSMDSNLIHPDTMDVKRIIPGSEIFLNEKEEVFFDNQIFNFVGETIEMLDNIKLYDVDEILNTAFQFLNVPYLWGGKSYFGIDCSGFTQTVFKINNVQLPRDAYQQAELGTTINFDNKQAGDLVFFTNEKNKISHVGICLNDNEIIHSSGFVRIDTLTENGIWNEKLKQQSHPLAIIKRIAG